MVDFIFIVIFITFLHIIWLRRMLYTLFYTKEAIAAFMSRLGYSRTDIFQTQQTEIAIGVAVLNCMLAAGRPNFVRSQKVRA